MCNEVNVPATFYSIRKRLMAICGGWACNAVIKKLNEETDGSECHRVSTEHLQRFRAKKFGSRSEPHFRNSMDEPVIQK
jgi:hypothetical protein